MANKQRVVILGGGVAALTTAFALTEGENAGKYDVTVYQLGWRLGGKGASGRNLPLDARIEEHGIHVWFGFYYNAIALLRRCYDELSALPGQTLRWEDGFEPHDYVVIEERVGDRWTHMALDFPQGTADRPPTPWAYIKKMLPWMVGELRAWLRRNPGTANPAPAPAAALAAVPAGAHPAWWTARRRDLIPEFLHGLSPAHLLEHAATLVHILDDHPDEHPPRAYIDIVALLDAVTDWAAYDLVARIKHDDLARRLWMVLDLGAAAIRGMLADEVVIHGFDVIDDHDIWDWLHKHGASRRHADSVFIRTLYSQAFAFPGGDTTARGRIAAGTTLRAVLRMLFAYRGPVLWKMRAGMGDVVFAPLYQVLADRGVRFEFFHRVRSLHVGGPRDRPRIVSVKLGRQARVPSGTYDPLVPVRDARVPTGQRPSWPNAPDYDQLDPVQVAEMRRIAAIPGEYVNFESHWSSWGPTHEEEVTLTERQFDHVVLGIPVGSLGVLCRDLMEADPRWRAMVERVQTVRTQAFQCWLRRDLPGLGWTLKSPVVTAYVEPLDTWADMSQTLPAEPHAGVPPRLVMYFCGAMADSEHEPPWFTDPAFPRAQHDAAFRNMVEFLSRHVRFMWPAATDAAHPDQLDWSVLHDPTHGAGIARLERQFWIANVDPNERYVLSLPGTTAYRLWSDESGFANLWLAGDWTRNALNAGCIEAAVTSGLRAARGLSGHPRVIEGEHDFYTP